jgi:ParG protein
MNLKRVVVWIDEAEHRRLKAECAARGISMASIFREFLEKRRGPVDQQAGLAVVGHHARCRCDRCVAERKG